MFTNAESIVDVALNLTQRAGDSLTAPPLDPPAYMREYTSG